MATYTLEQANSLVQYYSDKMIGKPINKSTKEDIITVEVQLNGENQYRVIGVTKPYLGRTPLTKSVDLIAIDLGLDSPIEVLNSQGLSS